MKPFLSVIVPTYNRPQCLAVCLQALAGQSYPRDSFEVLVADDGSPIPPQAVVDSFSEQLDARLLALPHTGPAMARNAAARQARGAYLVFTDDDCAADPGWLPALARAFVESPDHLLGGRTLNALPDDPYASASQLLIEYLYNYYNTDNRAHFFTSNNMALPASTFHDLGGFDASFPLAAGEDRELCDRWQHYGYPMCYVPQALVFHAHGMTAAQFWQQHFGYGRGAFHYHRIRAARRQERLKVEAAPFYLNLLRYPFFKAGSYQSASTRALFLSALLFVTQLANAVGFLWERRAFFYRKSDNDV
ncbi:MAG: glycosyltransferase [Chloroflexota bacterium]